MFLKVASFPCSLFSRDSAGVSAVVAWALPRVLPCSSRVRGWGKERGSPVFLLLGSAPCLPQRGRAQGVPSCRGGPACVAASQACARAGCAPGLSRPAPLGCGTPLGRCSAQPRPRFCVVLSCPVPPPRPLPCISQPSLAGFQSLESPPGFAGRLGCVVSSPAEEGGEAERWWKPLCRGLLVHCSAPSAGSADGRCGPLQRLEMEGRPRCALAALHPLPGVLGAAASRGHAANGRWVEMSQEGPAGAAQLASPPGSVFLLPCPPASCCFQYRGLEQGRGSLVPAAARAAPCQRLNELWVPPRGAGAADALRPDRLRCPRRPCAQPAAARAAPPLPPAPTRY